jgi:predicted AAA+ superfamily ATPase
MNPNLLARSIEPRLLEAMADSPVILIHGPRQCGKTTLAQMVGRSAGYEYLNFDDDVLRRAADADPVGFVGDLPPRVILDAVQRVPGLFRAIKTDVDRNRVPGRYILTGSTNVLLLPTLADSLAGRMELLRLFPLTQCEIEQQEAGFLDVLFAGGFRTQTTDRLGDELYDRIVSGGYPSALARSPGRRRVAWYRDYVETLIQRDVRELARIESLDAIPRLLGLVASQSAHLLNVSDLAAPFQLSRPTIRDYLTLLERLFLLETLSPWHTNRMSRLVKTPNLHIGDTGLACALLGVDGRDLKQDRALLGQLLETFVYQELRRQASWHTGSFRFHHFRDRDGAEVDIVIEQGARRIVGVEVKAAASINPADFKGLRKLREASGDRFAAGVVLYDGEATASFGGNLFAVPIRSLWETVAKT